MGCYVTFLLQFPFFFHFFTTLLLLAKRKEELKKSNSVGRVVEQIKGEEIRGSILRSAIILWSYFCRFPHAHCLFVSQFLGSLVNHHERMYYMVPLCCILWLTFYDLSQHSEQELPHQPTMTGVYYPGRQPSWLGSHQSNTCPVAFCSIKLSLRNIIHLFVK